jgi:toluene monooxygenase system protein E
MAQLREVRPDVAEEGKLAWQNDPKWQPLRKTIEELLVTYDWSEALIALNLCLKPAMDELFLVGLAEKAHACGDSLLGEVLSSLHDDSNWQLSWTRSLLRLLASESGKNISRIEERFEPWIQRVVEALGPLMGGAINEGTFSTSRLEAPGRQIIEDLCESAAELGGGNAAKK